MRSTGLSRRNGLDPFLNLMLINHTSESTGLRALRTHDTFRSSPRKFWWVFCRQGRDGFTREGGSACAVSAGPPASTGRGCAYFWCELNNLCVRGAVGTPINLLTRSKKLRFGERSDGKTAHYTIERWNSASVTAAKRKAIFHFMKR